MAVIRGKALGFFVVKWDKGDKDAGEDTERGIHCV